MKQEIDSKQQDDLRYVEYAGSENIYTKEEEEANQRRIIQLRTENQTHNAATRLTKEINHDLIRELKEGDYKYTILGDFPPDWLKDITTVLPSIQSALAQTVEGGILVVGTDMEWKESFEILTTTNSWDLIKIKFSDGVKLYAGEDVDTSNENTIITIKGAEGHQKNVELINVQIEGNWTSRCIYTEYANITANGSLLKGNAREGRGGGVFLGQGSKADLRLSIVACEARGGAGIAMFNASCQLNGEFEGGRIHEVGGACVFLDGESDLDFTGDMSATGSSAGGAVIISAESSLTMVGDIYAYSSRPRGGAIRNYGNVHMTGNIKACFASDIEWPNYKESKGGAIYTGYGATSTIIGSLRSCSATKGGAIMTDGNATTNFEGVITECRAREGAGVYNSANTTVNGNIINCGGYYIKKGAGVFTNRNSKTIIDGDIISSEVKEGGNAIYTDRSGYTEVKNIINSGGSPIEGEGETKVLGDIITKLNMQDKAHNKT